MSRWRFLLFVAVVALVIAADPAFAAEQADNSLDKITDLFKTGAKHWEEVLSKLAMQLFVILAAIELGWSAIKLALRGADFGEWLADFLNQILFIGFFYMLLQHSSEWAGFIVDSFRQAADRSVTMANAHATSMNEHIAVTPSNLFDMGMNLAGHIFEQVSITTPIANVGIDIAALLVLICFALIAAFMIVALVESYIVISAGVLLMGFGGSRWTKDYAIKTFVYAVSVGAKLFIIQLLAGTAYAQFQTLRTSFSSSLDRHLRHPRRGRRAARPDQDHPRHGPGADQRDVPRRRGRPGRRRPPGVSRHGRRRLHRDGRGHGRGRRHTAGRPAGRPGRGRRPGTAQPRRALRPHGGLRHGQCPERRLRQFRRPAARRGAVRNPPGRDGGSSGAPGRRSGRRTAKARRA